MRFLQRLMLQALVEWALIDINFDSLKIKCRVKIKLNSESDKNISKYRKIKITRLQCLNCMKIRYKIK